jgi:hypothetical protein
MSVQLWLPPDLEYFCSMDWGYHAPGVILWWAALPEHRLHIVREWKFKGLADEEIAAGYHARTKRYGFRRIRYVAGDPSMWIRDGRNATRGQSRAETFTRARMPMKKAENAREDGWARVHSLLRVPTDDEGRVIGAPLLTVDESCAYLRRSLPALVSDKLNADDVDTKGDDHGGDAVRYGAMSRPMPTVFRVERPIVPGTVGALLAEAMAGASASPTLGAGNVRARA